MATKATKPAPRIQVYLSQEIPMLMARKDRCRSYNWRDLIELCQAAQLEDFTFQDVANALTDAEVARDISKVVRNGNLEFELTPVFLNKWNEFGH